MNWISFEACGRLIMMQIAIVAVLIVAAEEVGHLISQQKC